eukprot:scaffold5572_cov83-Skeletonema_dohrnii-CCMP3373.AAC.4
MGKLTMLTVAILVAAVIIGASADNTAAAATSTNEKQDDGTYKFNNLVSWVQQNGGRVNDHLGITNHQHGNHQVVRGGVALDNIQSGSELLFLPWNIVFGTIHDTPTLPENKCDVLQSYASEVDAGRAPFWYPYLALDTSLSSRVPSVWSDLAISELQGLPPYGRTAGLTDWYSSNCANDVVFSDLPSSSRQALLAAVTRAAGLRFLPVYDLLNHHNGMLNTECLAVQEGVTLTTTTDIQKGDEIFNSYGGGQVNTVAEMFRKYGFVDEWPQYHSWEQRDEESDGVGDDGGMNTMHFLVLPGQNNVAIYPPSSMLSQIGDHVLNIDDLLAETEKHNQGLSTQQLIHFSKMLADLIATLITTVEEDTVILQQMNDSLRMMISQDLHGEIEQLTDILSAISYRIQFKQAIRTALDATNQVLSSRNDAGEL